jgi:O-antigen/teichoic acid export membrane protein
MRFSEHIGKGAWAFASRGLPLLYAIALIMVARSITPSEFGTLSVFQTLFTILFTFSDGFALQAIVKFGVEPDVTIEELVTVTTLLFIAFLGTALTILLIFPSTVSSILNIPQLGRLIPYLALFALFTMPRVVFGKVLQTRFRMKEIFFVDFANFGVASVTLVVFLSLGMIHSAEDVIRVTMATGLLSSLVATILVRPFMSYRMKYSRSMLSRISEFVRYQAAMGVVSTAQQNFDILIVSGFTGAIGAAIYNGAKMLFRGFDIVRETMTLFVFPASSKYYSRGDILTLRTIIEKSVGFLYLLLVPAGLILELVAPMIFHLLYGTKFDSSIPIFRVLLISALFMPVQMVFNVTMTGMGKIKEAFRMFSITLIVNVVIAWSLLALTHSLVAPAIAFVVATIVQTTQLSFYLRRQIDLRPKELWRRGFGDAWNFVLSLIKH